MIPRNTSIAIAILLATLAVGLSIAMLVGWTLVLVQSRLWVGRVWLLILGNLAFVVIMMVLVLFVVSLIRETLEGQRQTRFIDSVTHELKSPLASLRLLLETLGRPDLPDAKRESLRCMMLDDVDRLTMFIDDILQASQVQQRRPPPLAQVELEPLVQRCVSAVKRRHHLDADVIQVHIDPSLTLASNRTALEVVFKNLLDNSIKYSDHLPSIVVSATPSKDQLCIEVRDQGIGLPPTEAKRIFRRFYRVSSEQVRERRGTGLGLFVVRALIRGLNGRIEAVSEGPGKGTRMKITLPRLVS